MAHVLDNLQSKLAPIMWVGKLVAVLELKVFEVFELFANEYMQYVLQDASQANPEQEA